MLKYSSYLETELPPSYFYSPPYHIFHLLLLTDLNIHNSPPALNVLPSTLMASRTGRSTLYSVKLCIGSFLDLCVTDWRFLTIRDTPVTSHLLAVCQVCGNFSDVVHRQQARPPNSRRAPRDHRHKVTGHSPTNITTQWNKTKCYTHFFYCFYAASYWLPAFPDKKYYF